MAKCPYCGGSHSKVADAVACFRKKNDKPLPKRTVQPKAGVRMASDRQKNYIQGLLSERQYNKPVVTQNMTSVEASQLIETLLSLPKIRKDEFNPAPTIEGTVPPDGRYTVVLGDERRTIWFYTPRQGKFAGKTLVKYLSGSDNDNDYTSFGRVVHSSPSGSIPDCVYIWKKFEKSELLIRAVSYLLKSDQEEWAEAGEAYALASGNCFRCGRTLTVPASINRGMGPDCAAKGWL